MLINDENYRLSRIVILVLKIVVLNSKILEDQSNHYFLNIFIV